MIILIDCGSSKTPHIESIIYECMDVRVVPMFDFKREEHLDALGFVISGAPILITEVNIEPYLKQFEWLLTEEKPVLGICFGHQMLGLTYGAISNRQKEDRDWQVIELIAESPLFDKLPQEFEMMEDHCEAIGIPPNFKHLAVSDATINEAMAHQTKLQFGVQFHPEVSGNLGACILENFVHICEKATS